MKRLFGNIIILSLLLAALPAGRCANEEATKIDWAAHKITVVFFILHDCPICNSYVPEMNRISRQYGKSGFGFVAAYVDPGFSQAEAERHAREYGFAFPFIIDSDHQLSAKTGTTVVPEAAVFSSRRDVLYRGRIDDLYADIGTRRARATATNLRDALEDIAAGRNPRRALMPGAGCLIEQKVP